jgi:hypothetical protein
VSGIVSTEAAPLAVQGNATKRVTDRHELSDGPGMTKAGCFNKLLVLKYQNKWTTLPGYETKTILNKQQNFNRNFNRN